MWGGYDHSDLDPRKPRKCCGQRPMLRQQEGHFVNSYVEFVCRRCGKRGGLSMDEEEARLVWDQR